jgi:hypothetical protein
MVTNLGLGRIVKKDSNPSPSSNCNHGLRLRNSPATAVHNLSPPR